MKNAPEMKQLMKVREYFNLGLLDPHEAIEQGAGKEWVISMAAPQYYIGKQLEKVRKK